MPELVGIAAIAAAATITIIFWRRSSGPSVAMFMKIDKHLQVLQEAAAANVMPESDEGKVRAVGKDTIRQQTGAVANTIRFVYTIEQVPGGLPGVRHRNGRDELLGRRWAFSSCAILASVQRRLPTLVWLMQVGAPGGSLTTARGAGMNAYVALCECEGNLANQPLQHISIAGRSMARRYTNI